MHRTVQCKKVLGGGAMIYIYVPLPLIFTSKTKSTAILYRKGRLYVCIHMNTSSTPSPARRKCSTEGGGLAGVTNY